MDLPSANQRLIEGADSISSERLKRLYRYWDELRGARFAPGRTEINPSAAKEHLTWMWLMDTLDNGDDFRFRLGGDRVIQFFGQRIAGLRLKEVTPMAPAFFGRFMDLAQLATRNKRPALGGPAQTEYEPRAFLEVEAILLPLSDDAVNVSGLVGSIEIRPLAKAVDPRD